MSVYRACSYANHVHPLPNSILRTTLWKISYTMAALRFEPWKCANRIEFNAFRIWYQPTQCHSQQSNNICSCFFLSTPCFFTSVCFCICCFICSVCPACLIFTYCSKFRCLYNPTWTQDCVHAQSVVILDVPALELLWIFLPFFLSFLSFWYSNCTYFTSFLLLSHF